MAFGLCLLSGLTCSLFTVWQSTSRKISLQPVIPNYDSAAREPIKADMAASWLEAGGQRCAAALVPRPQTPSRGRPASG